MDAPLHAHQHPAEDPSITHNPNNMLHVKPLLNVLPNSTTSNPSPASPPSSPEPKSSSEQGTPNSSHPTSSSISTPIHTIPQQLPAPPAAAQQLFVTPQPSFQVSSRTSSLLSSVSAASLTRTTCVICMDNPKDIALAPCKHSHCCFSCFQRSKLRTCPMCRTKVTSILILATQLTLPVSLVAPAPTYRDRTIPARAATMGVFGEPVTYERPTRLHTPRAWPPPRSRLDNDTASIHSRPASVSSSGIATQAESSVRSLPRSQDEAFRRLRETGSVHMQQDNDSPTLSLSGRRHTIPADTPSATRIGTTSAFRNLDRGSANDQIPNVVLVGHTRKAMLPLAKRLMTAFPPPRSDAANSPPSKSTIFVNGRAMRLVLIACAPISAATELAARVQRHSPKLILLCADFYNISSFEAVVRLDMEVLDYLNISCVWILVKPMSLQRQQPSNFVEDADVRTAKHFLSSPRRCFMIEVDGSQENANMRKLGMFIYRCAHGSSTPVENRIPELQQESERLSRTSSFFCLRFQKSGRPKPKRRQSSRRWSTANLVRWLR